MARQGESRATPGLQVRGTVDVEKFKAARSLGGDETRFELRAMRPAQAGTEGLTILCIVCIVCIVCFVARAEELGVKNLPALQE